MRLVFEGQVGRLMTVCLTVAVLAACRLDACTLWGAAGASASGGTIISKNRDWKPDHTQELKLERLAKGHAYFGLYAVGGTEPGIKAGVNETGLTVVTASASSIPKSKRDKQPGKRGVTARLLSGCATCDEVLAKKDAIFPESRAQFVMISDRAKILVVEIGLEGKYAVKVLERGFAAHTNHFLEPALAAFNAAESAGSAVRLRRITQLLETAGEPCSAEAFAAFSRDRHDGPDNSLWRTGNGKNTRTLASWIVETPANGAPTLRVLLANPGQPEESRTFVLNPEFWRGQP